MKNKKEKVCPPMDVLGYRFRRTHLVFGLSAVLCLSALPSAYAGNSQKSVSTLQTITQAKTIKGKVVDEKTGETLTGVSVLVKGTTIGAITDIDGNFTLNLPSGKNLLALTYIGYKAQTVTVGNGKDLEIKMEPVTLNLDEVVVIGYGTMKKRDLTGAITSIKSADIAAAPTSNAMEALQGKVAGLDIVKSSGQAGADVNIQLRGTRSIYGDNSPLFIIDGIAGSYNQLNPSDIESIEVLKDASSTAIYGSAGANGVVIITTKKGVQGKTRVNLDAYVGVSGFAKYPSGMTGDEYMNLKREAYRGAHGSYPEFTSSIFTDPKVQSAYDNGQWIDFVDEVIGKASINQNYNLSITGGTDKTQVFASINYNDEQGLLKGDDRLRYGLRLNLDQKLSSWAKAGFNTNITYTDQNKRNQSVFVNALTFVPLGEAYKEDGSINPEYLTGQQNPMSDEINGQYVNNTRGTNITANGTLELTPVKGVSFKSVLGTTVNNSRTGMFFGPLSIANITAGYNKPLASIANNATYGYKWENILNYNFKIATDHEFGLTGVTSWSKNQTEYTYAAAQGQQLTSQSFWKLSAGTQKQSLDSDFKQTQSMSYAARLNYNFKGRYIVTLSNRWDGVSHLAVGSKWDSFPAAAFAWRISDESFMEKSQDWLSNLKLRVGYGITGNSGGMGAYSSNTAVYTFLNPVVFGSKAAPVVQFSAPYGNPSIGWEKSYNTNIGVDASFLNGRINLAVDLSNTNTKGLLFKRTLPITAGVTMWGSPINTWQNIGETNNKNLEVMLNTQNIVTKDFTWSTVTTLTFNKEKIVKLPDGDIIAESLFKGKPIRAFYNYKYLGIWSEAETDEAKLYGCVPGDIKLATNPIITKDAEGNDVSDNGVHKYSEKDKMYLGSKNPDWYLGFQNNFTYRNFDASIFVMARCGQMLQSDLITRYNPTTSLENSPSGISYWTPENQGAYLPRPGIHSSTSQYYGWGSLALRDGSFIKIKNITLGYTLPKSLLKSAHMEKLRVYATAYNPFIFAFDKQMKGQDPEREGSDNFPLTKEFVFGVNVTF